jgi:hypothetical protein
VEPFLVGEKSPVWTHGLSALNKHVTSSSFVEAVKELNAASAYLSEIQDTEGRFVPLSQAILESAGVTASGLSKLHTIQWLHHPKGARSMSSNMENHLERVVRKAIDLSMRDPMGDGRSTNQRKTDRLRERRNTIKLYKEAYAI